MWHTGDPRVSDLLICPRLSGLPPGLSSFGSLGCCLSHEDVSSSREPSHFLEMQTPLSAEQSALAYTQTIDYGI